MTRAPFGSKGSSKDSLRQQAKMLQLRQELRVEQLGHSEEERFKTPGSQAAQRPGVQRLAFAVHRSPFGRLSVMPKLRSPQLRNFGLIVKISEDRRIPIQSIACRPSDSDFPQCTDMARLAFEYYNLVTTCASYETLWIGFARSLT